MAADQLMNLNPVSVEAGSDLSASQYCAVTVNSSSQLALPSANASIFGILYDNPAAQGRTGKVMCGGVVKWRAGGTVAAGDKVKTDSSGRCVAASAGDIAAGYGMGQALTGASTNGVAEVLLLPALGVVAVTGVQALTDSGAIDLTTEITTLAITGTDAYSLADGLYTGQRKIIRCISAASVPVGVVTPTTTSVLWSQGTVPTTLTFNTAGQEATLEWQADGWAVIATKQAGLETVAHTGTANPLCAQHSLAVDGTDDAIIPSGMFTGELSYWTVISAANTPIQTISGLFYDEDGSADGIDVNFNAAAAANCVLLRWGGERWIMVNHINATIST